MASRNMTNTWDFRTANREAAQFFCLLVVIFLFWSTNDYLYKHHVALPLQTSASHSSSVTPPAPAAQPAVTASIDPATKAWTYNFASQPVGRLNPSFWNFENGTTAADYNNEAQAYTSRPHNVRIDQDGLIIEAHKESLYGRQYTSARINTLDSFSFTYGTIEVDMKLPSGKGTWPAAWLMPRNNVYNPADNGVAPDDPYGWAMNGEIDFAEAIGSLPGENIPAAHSINQLRTGTIYTPGQIQDPTTTYHRFGVTKTPDSLTFTIDGVPYASRHKQSDSPLDWPYNQPYYLILNLAVGGKWAGADGIDDASAPWQLRVRSVSYKPL